MWSLLLAVLVHLSGSRTAGNFHRIHLHSRNCHRIDVFRLCSLRNHTESQTVDNISMCNTQHFRQFDPSTRRDRRKYYPMECIRQNDTETSRPSNCHAASRQYLANIFRSIRPNYRRSPAKREI